MRHKNLRIITFNSMGLLNDALIYKNIFKMHKFQVSTYINNINNLQKNQILVSNRDKTHYFDINLFLENIGPDYQIRFPARINMFMPNQDLFVEFDNLGAIDFILCKTKITFDMFVHIKNERNYTYHCIYTKFTTFIPKELRLNKPCAQATCKDAIIKKNDNLFVHFAGKSRFKNTFSLVACWIKNNGFIDTDPYIILRITCYKKCLERLQKRMLEKLDLDINSLKQINDKYIYKNLELYGSPAPEKEYVDMLKMANVAICPSEREGFGHYINEARYFGTFIISIDAPPMNELVIDKVNGVLIEAYTTNRIARDTSFEVLAYFPNIDELAEKITYCIKNKNNFADKRQSFRKKFFEDMFFLYKSLDNLIKKSLTVN